jgi:F-box and WD-40 domain protein 1/11
VLCLQFDASPENDIVVSGGSDSWVIIWRFSTGEMIKKMDNAHTESVLNLRFDHRYIVTCSKDKTIKIWNRHAITSDSPIVPAYVVHQFDDPMQGTGLIKEHTLLTTLTGHGAAVNAVMIHKDTIVSASGDRTIRAWNIQTGKCEKNYLGHTKGIACVQYDGRRIISGSSDNTVRIFDADRQVEVACLTGHSNLVRTVQARFGDLETVTDEELYNESQRADQEFYNALEDGMQPAAVSRQATRNAGSSRPEHMLSNRGEGLDKF